MTTCSKCRAAMTPGTADINFNRNGLHIQVRNVPASLWRSVYRSRPIISLSISFLLLSALQACQSEEESGSGATVAQQQEGPSNVLTAAEQAAGWKLLFDGETFNGWRGLGRNAVPHGHWVIADGCIQKVESSEVPAQVDGQPSQGGDLMTVETFENFEFAFDWKISRGGNSGVKYNVSEELSTSRGPRYAALGFEYQVLDDDRHADGLGQTHRTAALYDMIAPQNAQLRPVGEFNHSRIVFNGNHGEHWLNGDKVVEYEMGTAHFDSLLAASKYRDIPGFADRRKGHLILQDHSDAVWYRNLKIRVLPASPKS